MTNYILLAFSVLLMGFNLWFMYRAEKRREWLSGALHLTAVIFLSFAIVDRIMVIVHGYHWSVVFD